MRAIVQCTGRRINLSPFVSVWNWCGKCCKPCFTPSVLWSGRVWTEEIGKGLWILIFIRPVFLVSFTYKYTLIINWWLGEWSPDTTLAQQGDIHGDTMGRKHPYTVQEIANRLSYPGERKSFRWKTSYQNCKPVFEFVLMAKGDQGVWIPKSAAHPWQRSIAKRSAQMRLEHNASHNTGSTHSSSIGRE